ncbi:hypothetical protein GCM10010919_14510 [Alishewanella longhuensis]|uniref:Adhesin n=2 Tax=Alishewanella longhuensis TaxID=1091037 RepID=A0ABQ3L283_9ALTE|nr:hypothetical protein GCM10010919_14510 [Alishewanella longhuensis]
MRILITIFICLLSNHVLAQIDAYKCTVNHSSQLKENGETTPSDFSKMQVGKEFVVDKGSGRMTGELANHNSFGEPRVLDYGSTQQGFKVLTIYKPMISVEYLYIEEFSKNDKKPFMLIDGNIIYSGLCAPY